MSAKSVSKRDQTNHRMTHGWNDAHQHLSHCAITHHSTCTRIVKEKKWHTIHRLQPFAISCKLNLQQQTFFFEKNGLSRELQQLLDVSQFHHELEEEKCHLWSRIGAFLPDLFSVWNQCFLISQILLFWISCRSGPPVPTIYLDANLLGPAIFWVSNHEKLGLLEMDLEFHHILFDTSLSRVVGQEMLFLCFSFAVPNTTRSLVSDDVVRDWESIQSPSVKILARFAFNQEMSTNAIDHSMTPKRRHSGHCTFGIVSHNSNNSTLPISRIIAFESWPNGLWTLLCCKSALDENDSRSSSRALNSEMFCVFHNCM